MRKSEELVCLDSCFNKARYDEYLFVLMGRDAATPETIRFWVAERIRLGLNTAGDPKMTQALNAADAIEQDQAAGATFNPEVK